MTFGGEVTDASMAWMDGLWDDEAGLLWAVRRDRHLLRETAIYALGLLRRGDVDRAERALRSVLVSQFPMDGAPFEGTFRRAPEEPDPPDEPVMWIHYDPNWRQFIGTNLAVIIDQHGDELSDSFVDELRSSITDCVHGEPDERVAPTYANIALMKAWLDVWAGRHDVGESMARATYGHFDVHGAFLEYNSPTYYGIDLIAVAMWRSSSSALLRRLGADMEERLWRDIARFYHAGLRNLCGPYDRAYGMEMASHATPLGLHVWSVVGRELAPFPETSGKFSHPHDFCFGPFIAAVPSRVPDDVVRHLESFDGERWIDEQIVSDEPKRVVTAWLGEDAMVGGWQGPPSGIGFFQHAHGTIHAREGWARVMPDTPVECRAEPRRLVIEGQTVKLETHGTIRLAFETNVEPLRDGDVLVFESSGAPIVLKV